MRKVLHVGPCDSPGGMATVMRTLAEYPPDGWEAALLSSHSSDGHWAKWRAYRRARKELLRRSNSSAERPDIVHFHVASDWSWRRKQRLFMAMKKKGIAVVFHLHSGQFKQWLTKRPRRLLNFKKSMTSSRVTVVALSERWSELYEPLIGATRWISNPIPPQFIQHQSPRQGKHLLLLGRPDPVKGHDFALEVVEELRKIVPDVTLTMTGSQPSSHEWVDARGWVTEEEKWALLHSASVLLLPSIFEGQPLVALEAESCGLPSIASSSLHSLPSTTIKVERQVQAWVDVINRLLEQPPLLKPVDVKAKIEHIQTEWAACYDALLVD